MTDDTHDTHDTPDAHDSPDVHSPAHTDGAPLEPAERGTQHVSADVAPELF